MAAQTPPLSDDEIERYARHIVLPEIGGPGQQRLKRARVLVVGAGGLGAPVLAYLAAAGVGTIGIVDDDTVSLDNLQRQIAHATSDVGRPKVDSARDRVAALNPHVQVEAHRMRIDAGNALALIGRYDIVIDGSDNFATRYLVSDACHLAKKTLVFAALGPFDGYVTCLKPFDKTADGEPLPTYRCLFPEAPAAGTVANCAEVGILGAVAGVIGTLAAVEILKEITGVGEPLTGRLLMYDARAARFETLKYRWDPDNPLSGRAATIEDLSIHEGVADPSCAA
jgi:adenylyltransferase/sulfurtransferase